MENDAAGIWAAPGHILLPRANGLFAAPFDAERLTLTADPVFVSDPARWDGSTGISTIASSAAGLIAFRPQRDTLLQYEWLDKTSRSLGRVGSPAFYGSFALSRDGTRIVSRVLSETNGRTSSGLAVIDLERGVSSPVEVEGGALSDPIWTADGLRILYRRNSTLVSQSPYGNDVADVMDKDDSFLDKAIEGLVLFAVNQGELCNVPEPGADPGVHLRQIH